MSIVTVTGANLNISDRSDIRSSGAFLLEVDQDGIAACQEAINAAKAFHALEPRDKFIYDMVSSESAHGYYPSADVEACRYRAELPGKGSGPGRPKVHDRTNTIARTYETLDICLSNLEPGLEPIADKLFGRTAIETLPPAIAMHISKFDAWIQASIGAVSEVFERLGGLPIGTVQSTRSNSIDQLRLLHYPSSHDQGGLKAHTDYEWFTFCLESDSSGLELLTPDTWTPVQIPHGCILIMFGDLAEVASNGRVRAATHRVRTSGERRYSIAYFCGASYSSRIVPIGDRGEVGQRPVPSEGILFGEHLAGLTIANYQHLRAAIETGVLKAPFTIPSVNPLGVA